MFRYYGIPSKIAERKRLFHTFGSNRIKHSVWHYRLVPIKVLRIVESSSKVLTDLSELPFIKI